MTLQVNAVFPSVDQATSRCPSPSFDLLSLLPTESVLQRLALERAREYQTNSPFPHIVFDDFLPRAAAEAALAVFPSPQQKVWYRNERAEEKKLWANDEKQLPPAIRNLLLAMNSATFLSFLEALTGIEGLLADPYLKGGGMHQIVRGGHLGVHLDFNKYPKFKLDRRLNLIVYLNKNWEESYGGHLELWKDAKSGAVRKILPVFNRCVVFSTNEGSYHGHPHPLTCPEDRSRKSLALYYYSNGPAKGDGAFRRGTTFLDHKASTSRKALWRSRLRYWVREFTPPVVIRLIKQRLAAWGIDH